MCVARYVLNYRSASDDPLKTFSGIFSPDPVCGTDLIHNPSEGGSTLSCA